MKTQMKYQKIISLVSLVFAALTIVYSFCFNGGMLFEIRYYVTPQYSVGGAKELYDFTQSAANVMAIFSIVTLLTVAIIYLTNTNKRRNYYVTNYVAIGLVLLCTFACAIILLVVIGKTFSLCAAVDLDAWYQLYKAGAPNPQHYSTSKYTLIIGIFVAIIMLVVTVAWVLNLVWKIKLMQGEKALLRESEVKEVA